MVLSRVPFGAFVLFSVIFDLILSMIQAQSLAPAPAPASDGESSPISFLLSIPSFFCFLFYSRGFSVSFVKHHHVFCIWILWFHHKFWKSYAGCFWLWESVFLFFGLWTYYFCIWSGETDVTFEKNVLIRSVSLISPANIGRFHLLMLHSNLWWILSCMFCVAEILFLTPYENPFNVYSFYMGVSIYMLKTQNLFLHVHLFWYKLGMMVVCIGYNYRWIC